MIAFCAVAAAMTVVALLCVVAPLLRRAPDMRTSGSARALALAVFRANLAEVERDVRAGLLAREHRDEARQELERELVDDTAIARNTATRATWPARGTFARAGLAALLLASIPASALGLYLGVGQPLAIAVLSGGSVGNADDHAMLERSPEIMVTRLAVRLARDPGDAQGWALLGRSYAVLGRYDDAVAAWHRALAQLSASNADDTALKAQWLADLADIEATAADGDLNGAARASIDAALAADAANPKALSLAGSAAFDRRDFAAAIRYWQRLASLPGLDANVAAQARANVSAAHERLVEATVR
jgi:cytochrome c-type biogenesis protein CcmH